MLPEQVDADVKAGKKVELMLVNRDGDMTYVGLKLELISRPDDFARRYSLADRAGR